VAATIHPAPIEAEADAGTGIGAHVDRARVHAALCRRQHHVDRHDNAGRLLGERLHCDSPEIVGIDQPLLKGKKPLGRVVLAFAPRDEAVEKLIGELRLREAHRPETVARTALVLKIDGRDARRTHHLDAVAHGLGIEIPRAHERGFDLVLRLLVRRVIEALAFLRLRCLDGILHAGRVGAVAFDPHEGLANDDRLAGIDLEERVERVFGGFELARDDRVVVAVRLERLAQLVLAAREQAPHLRGRDVALDVLIQRETAVRGVLQLVLETLDGDAQRSGRCCARGPRQRQNESVTLEANGGLGRARHST
jgi:hypothetical protein